MQARLWADELCPALAAEGIVVTGVDDLNDEERAELDERFDREIYPVLTPLAVGPGQPFPYISPLSVSLGVFVDDPDTGEVRFARVKVPEGLPRFLPLGRRGRFVALEHVLAHYLPRLFPGMDVREWSLFRVTRDADLDVSDEADDLLEAVELELRRARFGEVTRLEVAGSMSRPMRDQLQQGLRRLRRPRLPARGDARPRRSRPVVRSRPARTSRTTSGALCGDHRGTRWRRRPSSSRRSATATFSSTTRTTRSPRASSRTSTGLPPTRR